MACVRVGVLMAACSVHAFSYDYSYDQFGAGGRADAAGDAATGWKYESVYADADAWAPGAGTRSGGERPNAGLKDQFKKTPPNIVVFYADDLGWGDLGSYGHPTQHTPFIDRLAAEGVRFKDFYAPASVCSPSRAGLLTGRLQGRTGVWPGFVNTGGTVGLDASEYTIPRMLKDAHSGYKSMLVGKWHLGAGEDGSLLPMNYGFDYFAGIVGGVATDCFPGLPCYHEHLTGIVKDDADPAAQLEIEKRNPLLDGRAASDREEVPLMRFGEASGYLHSHNFTFHKSKEPVPKGAYVNGALYLNDKIVQQPVNSMDMAFHMMHAAGDFLNATAAAGKPAFLYLNFYSMHRPLAASPVFFKTSQAGIWGDTLKELDFSVGHVMKKLHELKIQDNTLVVFSSDNGPTLNTHRFAGSAGPFKCGKGTTYEGGMRVPGIFWMPKYVAPGATGELGSQLDLLPTFMEMVGGALPSEEVATDGVSLYGLLFEGGWSPRREVYYWTHHDANKKGWNGNLYAVRSGAWKLHFATQGSPSHAVQNYTDGDCAAALSLQPRLHHLGQDPGEKYPLPLAHPAYADVVTRLTALAKAHLAKLGKPHPSVTRVKQLDAARPCCGRGTCSWPEPGCCRCQPDPKDALAKVQGFFAAMHRDV